MLSLGVADPVTKSVFGAGAVFFERLAQELTNVLYEPLQGFLKIFRIFERNFFKECGGTMTLADAYCRWNRARGLELVSPEDLLNACNKLEKINSPIWYFLFCKPSKIKNEGGKVIILGRGLGQKMNFFGLLSNP